jgi:pimeloyl-ACP methyl ester carboxylesterase
MGLDLASRPLIDLPDVTDQVAAGTFGPYGQQALEMAKRGFCLLDLADDRFRERADLIRASLEPLFDLAGWRNGTAGDLRLQDGWQHCKAVRELALHAVVLELLRYLYGRDPFCFQTLTFPVGSQQHFHSDAVHFHSYPYGFMCGVWMALETIEADAGPLVFTTGSDLPSSLQLPVWLSRSGADVLRARPIVAVDRRGMGLSSPIDCRDDFDRVQMREQTQFTAGDDPVASLGAITTTATTGCTDVIAPGDSAYDNARAAEDLERLRSIWDVPAMALLGIGNGAQVALAYAGSHPEKVARLVLDSPIPAGVSAETDVLEILGTWRYTPSGGLVL